MVCVFFLFKNSSTESIIPKKDVSAVLGIYEKTVFAVSLLIACKIFGINNLPSIFLSLYISASPPREK